MTGFFKSMDEFEQMYSLAQRSSIPLERQFGALLLQIFKLVRSQRLLMEKLNYNLLCHWFIVLEVNGFRPCEQIQDSANIQRQVVPKAAASR